MINNYVQEALNFGKKRSLTPIELEKQSKHSLKKLQYGRPLTTREVIQPDILSGLDSLPFFLAKQRKK